MARRLTRDWFVCPVCGEEVPAKALACPGCGSDDRTGWSPETEVDGLDLPDPEEAEAEWVPEGGVPPTRRVSTWILVTTILLAILFVVLMVMGIF